MNKFLFSLLMTVCFVAFLPPSVFGQTGSIGGRVVKDFQPAGVIGVDDTVGIPGVTIVLKSTNNNTVAPFQVATTLTDANGYFLFPNLAADFYVLFPSNYNGNTWSFFTPSQGVNLAVGQSVSNLKVGYYFPLPPQYLPISGKTFVDTQPNNVLNSGEIGLAGVKVYLDSVTSFYQGSFFGVRKDSTVSDGNGNFAFLSLPNNVSYLLFFVPPSGGYIVVSANAQYSSNPYQSSTTRFTNIALFKSFNCPNDTTVTAVSGLTAVVNYPPPTGISGYCSSTTTTATLLSGLASGANFPIGTTPVKLRANIINCSQAFCEFKVTVHAACSSPVITSQTTNTTLDEGQTTAFNVVVTGSPTITYRWFKTTNPTATLSTTANYTIAAAVLTDAGAYQCEISNACGTIISATANLTVNPLCTPPTAPYVGAPHAIAGCGNVGAKAQRRDANFNAIGGLTFEWYEFDATMPDNKGALLKIQTTTNADPISFYNWNPTPSATIQVKKVVVYENLGGCYSPNSEVELTVFPQPVNDLAIVGATTACGQVNINAVPPTPLTLTQGVQWWRNAAHDINPSLSLTPNFTTSDESLTFAFVFKTEFRPHIAGDLTCFSDPLFLGITVKPLPVVSITNLASNYCQNAAPITLSGLPIGGSFAIDGNTATIFDPSVQIVGNHTVTYSVTVNGCSNSASQTVLINAQPSITIAANPTAVCAGQSSQLSATVSGIATGYTISWDNGLGNGGIKSTGPLSINTVFTASVTTTAGCTATSAPLTVVVNPIPTVSITNLATNYCKNASPITLTGLPTGGSFTIDGIAATTFDAAALTVGNHTVTYSVTVNGCSNSASQTVLINAQPSITIAANPTAVCAGQSSQLSAVISGLSTGYTISWDNGLGNGGIKSTGPLSINTAFTASVTTTAGCTAISSPLTVVVNPIPTVSITNLATNYCKNASPITLTGLPTGGSFTIDGIAATTFDAAALTVGNHTVTYSVTVNGCSNSASQTVLINAQPSITIAANPTAVCAGQSSQLSAVISGLSTGYTISWDNGLGNGGIKSTGPLSISTTYTASVTTTAGCTAISSPLTVSVSPPIVFAATSPTTITSCEITGVSIPVSTSFTGGTTPFQRQWLKNGVALVGETSSVLFFNALTASNSGVYTLKITDATDCVAISPTVLTLNIQLPPTANVVFTPILCNGGTSTLTATPSYGAISNYQYSINGGATFGASNVFTVAAGTYQVIVYNEATYCFGQQTVVITQPNAILATATATNGTCSNPSGGQITVNASGGTPPYQFSKNGGAFQTSNIFTALTAGNYAIDVKDANACSITINQNITGSTPPQYNATFTPILCFGQKSTLTITPTNGAITAFKYSIDGGTTFKLTNVFANVAAGTYQIVVANATNAACSATSSVTITQPTALLATVAKQNITCNNANDGQISVAISGGVSPYQVNFNGAGFQANTVFANLNSGTYNLIIKDVNNCILNKNGNVVTNPSVLTLVLDSLTPIKCNGAATGKIYTTGTGGTGTKMYSKNNGTTWQTSSDFVNLSAGTYNLLEKDANNCISNAISTTLTEPSAISFSTTKTNETCNDANNGTITVTATGGTGVLEYSKNNGSTYQMSPIFTGLSAGNYVLKVRDANLCVTASQTVNISQPNVLAFSTSVVTPLCNGGNNGKITVTASGGTVVYMFVLNNGTPQSTNVFTALSAGSYAVKIVDANGCFLTKTVVVTDPSVLTLVLDSMKQIKCNGGSTGAIYTTGTGGTGSKMYSKNNGTTWQSSSDFVNLPVGTYNLLLKDANNCISNAISTTLTEPSAISFSTAKTNETCNDANNGTITVSASGGFGTFEYSKNNGGTYQISPIFTGLSAGNYTIKVRDANGCVAASQTVTITQPTAFTFATVTIPSTCNGIADAKITVRNYGGGNGAPYQFSKNNGANYQVDSVFLGLSAGNYFVKIKDVNGCESPVRNLTVTQPAPVSFVAIVSDITCGYTANGVIGITTVAGGTPQYNYSKNGGTSFQSSNAFVGLPVGTYPIRVKDSKGCLSAIVNSTVANGCPTQDLRQSTPPTPTQRIPIVIQKLSPNPTEAELNLEVNSLTIREQQFSFYDILGKQVQSETRILEQGINRLSFDCSALPQGAYLIQTPGSVGNNQPRRFIKL